MRYEEATRPVEVREEVPMLSHAVRILIAVALVVPASAALGAKLPKAYPDTHRVDHTDDYHGTQVADPYRWLEDDVRESDEVAAWVRAQNKITFKYLESIRERDAIYDRLEELWNYEKYSAPWRAGGRYFYSYNSGLQNQNVLYTMDALDGEARIVLDPNTWSEDGTVALSGFSTSDDGKYMAYARSSAGSDWREWFIMDLDSGELMPETLHWIKWGSASWTKDGRGFFYSRFPEPEEGAEFQALNLDHSLYYHRVGTDQSQDSLVFHRPDEPEWGMWGSVSEDGRYLVITVSKGTDQRFRIFYKDLTDPYSMPMPLIENFDHEYSFVGNDGPVFYFKTDLDAPMGRVIAIDTRKPDPENWREIIPEAEWSLQDVGMVGNLFVCSYLKDVLTHVRMFDVAGTWVRDVELPGIGSASGFGGKRSQTETFYSFSSYATPPSIYRYDMITGESTLWRRADVDIDPEDYVVEQVFYESEDGTRVPMFIVHKEGIELDGTNPTLLYGYGGFNISLTPRYRVTRLGWLELGGVYAVANLRGGGEYGEDWHKAGTKLHKQNVFDDFIAAAEWLIDNGYTRSDKLGILGGSNGGLLVGACITQRPELFGAAIPAVGVMDMLRFHKFTAGRYWVDDYGSSDDPDEFQAQLAYSPYHNIRQGTAYPPTLVTTADTDDRVVPGHSFKFTAAMQHAQTSDAPILIRIETKAGHGGGMPTEKVIEEYADMWAFLVETLDMEISD